MLYLCGFYQHDLGLTDPHFIKLHHRRTGNFLPGGGGGGGGNYLPPKFSPVAQIFTKQSMQQHRPTYEEKVFLHMNLSYELIKHVKRNSCLCHFDGRRYQWYDPYICIIVDKRVGICPFNVNKCDITETLLPMVLRRYVFNLRNALNYRSAEPKVAGITLRI